MKKIAKLLAYSLVALMLAGGFAGSAAAYGGHHGNNFNDNQVQYSDQSANSHVSQHQWVDQENNNHGFAAAGSIGGHATAVNANFQSNHNSQGAYSNAQNFNWQSQHD